MNPAILLAAAALVTMLLGMGGKKKEVVPIVPPVPPIPPTPPSPGDPVAQFTSSALRMTVN